MRYIANRSSGKQGHAIAAAAAAAGADVTLVSGPVNIPEPAGVKTVKVESARDMLQAVEAALPADIAVFVAAVADWRIAASAREKIKKTGRGTPELELAENPDILATVAQSKARRPKLVIGFAAETERVVEHARAKLARKGCDWILANDVSLDSGVMGGDINTIHLITAHGVESWPPQSKERSCAGADCPYRRDSRRGQVMSNVAVKIVRLPHAAGLPLPAYQSEQAAGLDLMAAVPADAPVIAGARSARANSDRLCNRACRREPKRRCGPAPASPPKHGLTVLNAPGTVDSDYRGEIQVILVNLGSEPFAVTRGPPNCPIGDRAHICGQNWSEVENLDKTARGSGRIWLNRPSND